MNRPGKSATTGDEPSVSTGPLGSTGPSGDIGPSGSTGPSGTTEPSGSIEPSGSTGRELDPRSRDTLPIRTGGPADSREAEAPSSGLVRFGRGRSVTPAGPVDPPPAAPAQPAAPAPPPRSGLPRGVVAALVLGILVICGAVALNITTGALQNLNPFKNGVVQNRTVDRSGPAVLKAINDLGDFRAASGYYELVVDVEKDVKPVPSALAGRRTLFIAAGTVEVGVDLRGLGDGAIKVNGDRTSATITLPAPTIGEPRLDVDRSYIYSQQRGLIDRLRDATGGGDAEQQRELYSLANRRLAEAARANNELTTRGETNTRAMLQGLLRSLGYTDVTITFAAPSPN
jgi:Protein of unknown function (DUF4230)